MQSGEIYTARDTITSRLREFGITAYAARAFLSILENQPVSATNLCKMTGIPDSKIYYALKELEEKNLVIIQHGTPSMYGVLGIEQIVSSIQGQVDEEHQRRSTKVKELAKFLEPLHTKGNGEDVELAYIIKGQRNMVEKMRETIDGSKKEIIVMFDDKSLLRGIADSLRKARTRGAAVKTALAGGALEAAPGLRIRPDKSLCCSCNILIVDSERLITVSGDEPANFRAMVTQDDSMIYMSRQSYENPTCCASPKSADVEIKSDVWRRTVRVD